MRRAPRNSFDDDAPIIRDVTVFEPDGPRDTGLVDQHGVPIVRQREPIGYIRRKD